ncbi:N-acetylneuraminate 9-O-acetyltransferase [Clonorchis sinensis]|uniref:N-acetylneuraminate 9-O-acetyltransferase n=1 Tax=Clonorchis sinensis TaxID=79923 RepID=A0A8T1MY23_CLOSI|nr:N-acetylneuraminate 9-O-acetyltransferase [Clonorchis sinensis]
MELQEPAIESMQLIWRHEYFDRFKRLLFGILLFVVSFRGIQHALLGSKPCFSMFENGFVDADGMWQPSNCLAYRYYPSTVLRCHRRASKKMISNEIFFLGDSDLVPLFYQFASYVTQTGEPGAEVVDWGESENITKVPDRVVNLCFFYHTRMTDEVLTLLRQWTQRRAITPKTGDFTATKTACMQNVPSLVIVSLGKEEEIKLINQSSYETFYKTVAKIARTSKATPIIWMLQSCWEEVTQFVFLSHNNLQLAKDSPINIPLSSSKEDIKTKQRIDKFNSILSESLNGCSRQDGGSEATHILIVKAHQKIEGVLKIKSNGREIAVIQLLIAAPIQKRNQDSKPPRQRMRQSTCCKSPNLMSTSQYRLFLLISICFIATFLCFLWDKYSSFYRPQDKRLAESGTVLGEGGQRMWICIAEKQRFSLFSFTRFYEFVFLLSRMGAVLIYFYICDRTTMFGKTHKDPESFWLRGEVLCLTVLGLLSIRSSKHTDFNNLDVTREWKGWMQLYIVTYHFACGHSVVNGYISVRYLVSAYLFLSAYGHTCYFWRKYAQTGGESQDGTNVAFKCIKEIWPLVRRYLEVMYRMNLFAVVLCFMMNQKYMFYYFVPLISFWFTYLSVTMPLFFQILMRKDDAGGLDIDRAKLCRFVVKLAAFALMVLAPIELLHRTPSLFGRIFFTPPLRGIFTIYETWEHKKSSQEPWLFRWSLDRYTLAFGMIFTVFLKWCQQFLGTDVLPNALEETSRSQATSHKQSTWNSVAVGLTILGLTVTVAVAVSVYSCRDKTSAILLHPYICIIPILAYMSMRNALLPVRTRYSAFFAWCGDISLELRDGFRVS